MDSKNRMDGCVCANGAKVAEIVHPYCPAHVPPEMEEATEATRRDLAGWMATSDKLWAENASLRAEVERLNESTMTISWTERATEEACGVSVGLDPLSDVTWTSFYVGVEIRAFFVCLSQWERRVALAEVERLRAARVEPSPEERAAYRRGLADGVAMAKEHAEIDYGRGYIPSADLVWTYVDAALEEATR